MKMMAKFRGAIFKFWILCFFLHSSCGIFPEKEKNDSDPWLILGIYVYKSQVHCYREGNFWVRNISTNRSECIPFVLEARGQFADFYRERRLPRNLDYAKIASDFDTKIHPSVVGAFGPPSDINGDGKIAILILDIRDGAKEGGPFMAGFFDPIDLVGGSLNSDLRSNQREILYIDGKELTQLLEKDPLAFGSTLAHEYQHLIRFPRMRASGAFDDIWIDEGTSELASDIAGFGPQTHRLDCFVGADHTPCTGGVNNVSLIDWGRAPISDPAYILKQYSYTYAFMRYLYENSAPTAFGRNQFLYHTVNGLEGIRATDLKNLLQLFRISTGNHLPNPFPQNPLGPEPVETFFLLLHTFFGQIVQGMDLSQVERFDNGVLPLTIDLVSPLDLKESFPLEGFSDSGGYLNYIKDHSNFPEMMHLPSVVPAASFNKIQNPLNLNPITPIRIANSGIGMNARSLIFFEHNRSSRLTNTSVQNFTKLRDWNEFLKNWNSGKKDSNTRKMLYSSGDFSLDPEGIPFCGHEFILYRPVYIEFFPEN